MNLRWIFYLFLIFISCTKSETAIDQEELLPKPPDGAIAGYTIIKSGKFNGSSGYPTNGTASLTQDSLASYSIRLESDFTTSFATGAVTMYLSKSMNLNLNDSTSFIRLAVINKNGSHRFPLQANPPADMTTVVVWCQPAGVKFGHADLK